MMAPKIMPNSMMEFDGKRLRKAIARKTVDYNTSIVRALESRLFTKDFRDRHAFQPDYGYYTKVGVRSEQAGQANPPVR